MNEMGILRTVIAVENPEKPGDRRIVSNVMVDTGSEYTWVPRAVLEQIGLTPRRSTRFVAADSRHIERDVCFANLYVGDTSAPDILVFAEPGDMTLLGARALEGLNLRVDVTTKQLVSAGPVPAAAAYGRSVGSKSTRSSG